MSPPCRQKRYLLRFHTLARLFTAATEFTTFIVDINGNAGTENVACNPFCTLMRAHNYYAKYCPQCDRYCAWHALSASKPQILNCYAGLSFFSVPLVENQQVCGFIVCGKVRVKYQEYKAIDLMNIEPWENDTALRKAWWSLKVIDNNRLAAAVNLLSFMVNSFTSNTDTILVENLLTSSETDYSLSRHEKKRIAVLRYIEANLYSKLTLDSVAAHVCLSANYFSRFFKKRQGINFKTWVNQRRMHRAGELLRNTDQTIDHIARKLQYAQTSYFCRVFHATYHMSPQMYRRHRQLV
ncbi:PocR ligand-binding domain-containing protein [Salmonella enterica]|nr:helix-turn-helix domain-containing protein [Salmonella enterica]ECF6268617.1 helix-turn-helix domain-containing protein [Salmonella enterica subsp. arizonae]EAW8701067.1 helix-turn-helix domain-containing protein [Salmonella enterica]ECG1182743.1 transcriptional regulator [Salmonella enterica subsp. arizonae]ECH9223440.1 helix-turn-helix domain-containing protein [Salmonella enterica subsp. arizonae]